MTTNESKVDVCRNKWREGERSQSPRMNKTIPRDFTIEKEAICRVWVLGLDLKGFLFIPCKTCRKHEKIKT